MLSKRLRSLRRLEGGLQRCPAAGFHERENMLVIDRQ
jgi:hypothetical protein